MNKITDADIVMLWMSIPANMDKIPTMLFTKEVRDFIAATSDMIEYNGVKVYKIHGAWYKIKASVQFNENDKFASHPNN